FGPEAVAVAPWPEVEESVELVPEVPDALIELAALEPVTWTSLPIIVRTASRQPVNALPLIAAPFPAPAPAELPLAPEPLAGADWVGEAFWSGVVEFGVCAGGAAGVVPGCWGIVLGVCGAVLGVEVCDPAVAPLCWSEPAGELLLRVVWAATQIAESSSKENSIVLDLMAVSRLRCVSFLSNCRREQWSRESGGIFSKTAAFPYSEFASSQEKLPGREAADPAALSRAS